MFGLPLVVIIPLGIMILQTIAFLINGIILAKAGTPLTKDDVMAILQEDWSELIVLNVFPEMASATWAVVQPIFSYLYDIIVGLLTLFGVVKQNADGTVVVVKAMSPQMHAFLGKHLSTILNRMAKVTVKSK